ncbi:hypothetical protein AYI68_g5947 [Smittium mucronatum]|uniref:Uncharacterized protein n=1 Tax=Smittium mucronatum TaxID=133383 RepID=A0A1R0GSW5_9FUNG|nr:hypothetical protein AYI68_g5947 [Smittium mucronatum]
MQSSKASTPFNQSFEILSTPGFIDRSLLLGLDDVSVRDSTHFKEFGQENIEPSRTLPSTTKVFYRQLSLLSKTQLNNPYEDNKSPKKYDIKLVQKNTSPRLALFRDPGSDNQFRLRNAPRDHHPRRSSDAYHPKRIPSNQDRSYEKPINVPQKVRKSIIDSIVVEGEKKLNSLYSIPQPKEPPYQPPQTVAYYPPPGKSKKNRVPFYRPTDGIKPRVYTDPQENDLKDIPTDSNFNKATNNNINFHPVNSFKDDGSNTEFQKDIAPQIGHAKDLEANKSKSRNCEQTTRNSKTTPKEFIPVNLDLLHRPQPPPPTQCPNSGRCRSSEDDDTALNFEEHLLNIRIERLRNICELKKKRLDVLRTKIKEIMDSCLAETNIQINKFKREISPVDTLNDGEEEINLKPNKVSLIDGFKEMALVDNVYDYPSNDLYLDASSRNIDTKGFDSRSSESLSDTASASTLPLATETVHWPSNRELQLLPKTTKKTTIKVKVPVETSDKFKFIPKIATKMDSFRSKRFLIESLNDEIQIVSNRYIKDLSNLYIASGLL